MASRIRKAPTNVPLVLPRSFTRTLSFTTRSSQWMALTAGSLTQMWAPRAGRIRRRQKTMTWRYGDRSSASPAPPTGGRITIANKNDKVHVEILFDGTRNATCTTPKGSIRFDLACQG